MTEITRQPRLYRAGATGEMVETELTFAPLGVDGRRQAEAHLLYSTVDTGPQGPAAAILRYLPGARSQPHRHTGYELIYVLSGCLETDHGAYGPDSLVLMTPGSVHQPSSRQGCLGLVVREKPVRAL